MTNKQLFENFISENLDQIYRFAYGYMGNREDAEDVVNDSVVKALKAINRLNEPNFLSTWFYRILINTANTSLKRRGKVLLIDPQSDEGDLMFNGGGRGPLDAGPDLDFKDLGIEDLSFEEILGPLNPDARAVVILRYFEDKTLAEIAVMLNENLNTVKTRLYRALSQLRTAIANESY